MGKYISIIGGIAALSLGALCMYSWWYEVVIAAKAFLAVMLILGGILAVFAGVGEIRDRA